MLKRIFDGKNANGDGDLEITLMQKKKLRVGYWFGSCCNRGC